MTILQQTHDDQKDLLEDRQTHELSKHTFIPIYYKKESVRSTTFFLHKRKETNLYYIRKLKDLLDLELMTEDKGINGTNYEKPSLYKTFTKVLSKVIY